VAEPATGLSPAKVALVRAPQSQRCILAPDRKAIFQFGVNTNCKSWRLLDKYLSARVSSHTKQPRRVENTHASLL
jgi:hypothetical protein